MVVIANSEPYLGLIGDQLFATYLVNQGWPPFWFTSWFSFLLKLFVIDWFAENEKAHEPYDLRAFVYTWSARCRGGQIRTDDLLVPNQARYRATLHPELLNKAAKI